MPSGAVARTLYQQEVVRLVKSHKNLRAAICILEEAVESHPELERFCHESGLGLMVLLPGLGVQSRVRTDLDPPVVQAALPDEGWFPSVLIDRACGLARLSYAAELDAFCDAMRAAADDRRGAFGVLRDTLDRLLGTHPIFRGNIGQFMRLANFEKLLRMASPDASDHVFHSFRVFLAGCPVIDRFYDVFRKAHERFCVGPRNVLSVEYAWLLAAIFHDVGRPKEGFAKLAHQQLEDDELELRGKDTRWVHVEYQAARTALGSLAGHVAGYPESGNWDGGGIPDHGAHDLATAWTGIYDAMQSHSVIGALDFLATVFRTATAADERSNRQFVLTHAVPAALAILLHDWRMWKNAETWRLFPVNVPALPMAALLIYLDTWDDYRRREGQVPVLVRDYSVNAEGVHVTIEWGDSQAYEKERIKYDAFKRALKNGEFSLIIEAKMANP